MIFLVAFGALGFGAFLILLIARYAPHPAANVDRTMRVVAGGKAMPFAEFRELIIDLLEALQLEIVMEHSEKEELSVIVRSQQALTGGRYIVHAIAAAPGDIIDQPTVVRLSEEVKSDGRVSKGILITPYRILTDGLGNLEAPVELIDGAKLRALIEEHLDEKRLDYIAQYRGFGL